MVKHIKVISLRTDAIIHIGDVAYIHPSTNVLAVQREIPIFYENEGDLTKFSLFSQPIPQPSMKDTVPMNVINISPFIKVKRIKIQGVAASAIFQVGSRKWVSSEARVKHIRQLLRGKRP